MTLKYLSSGLRLECFIFSSPSIFFRFPCMLLMDLDRISSDTVNIHTIHGSVKTNFPYTHRYWVFFVEDSESASPDAMRPRYLCQRLRYETARFQNQRSLDISLRLLLPGSEQGSFVHQLISLNWATKSTRVNIINKCEEKAVNNHSLFPVTLN